MSVLKYFKNIPRSPPIGRQALIVIFFHQIRNEVPGKKKGHVAPQRATGPVAHPRGDRPLSPVGGGDRVLCFSLANKAYWISFLQRPKIYCDIFAEGFGNRVRIIIKFTEGVGCQFWWTMRPLKDDTRETTFHVISNYKLFCQRGCLVDADFTLIYTNL